MIFLAPGTSSGMQNNVYQIINPDNTYAKMLKLGNVFDPDYQPFSNQ